MEHVVAHAAGVGFLMIVLLLPALQPHSVPAKHHP